MLSILIPVYNFDVRKLLGDLLSQIELIDQKIEIILLDDGSDSQWHNQFSQWGDHPKAHVHKNENNQGRTAARRRLVGLSRYDHLLFMDCDAELIHSDYLNNYLSNISDYQVICGGHLYQDSLPSAENLLHWTYGSQVEVRSLDQRLRQPYTSFSTFNFCCHKDVYLDHLREIEVDGYGHEDTVIGHVLSKKNISIMHIDNPLVHIGLKSANQFLKDTKAAIDNAFLLVEKYPDLKIRLIENYKRIKGSGLSRLVKWILSFGEDGRQSNLKSNDPSIKKLQLFKLYYALNKKR